MPHKCMYISNDNTHITHSIDYNTQLNKPINQNSMRVPKVVKPTNKKTLGTSLRNSPMSPPSLCYMIFISFKDVNKFFPNHKLNKKEGYLVGGRIILPQILLHQSPIKKCIVELAYIA